MSSCKYDLILYDLDGTIWDSVGVIMDSFKACYQEVLGSCDRTDEDLMSYIGRPLIDTFEMHDAITAQKLFDAYLVINERYLRADALQLFPNVMEDLTAIKNLGIKQGVVTSKKEDAASITLELRGLDSFFDVYGFKESTPKHKPDAEPLIWAASQARITDMSRVLYVGDAMPDCLCAKNAGSDFALVSWSKMDKDAIMAAGPVNSRLIDRIIEIVK